MSKYLVLSVLAGVAAGGAGIFLHVFLIFVLVALEASANLMEMGWLVRLLHLPNVLTHHLSREPVFFGGGILAAIWGTARVKSPTILQSALGGIVAGSVAAIFSTLLPGIGCYTIILVSSEHFYDPDPVGAARASYVSAAITTLGSAIISGAIGSILYTVFDRRRKQP